MSRWKPDAAGRLVVAAITLFEERGYDQTTVADIADAAGLTRRTFFRYFTDKREVLFSGSAELQDRWVDAIATAPSDAGPMAAVSIGMDRVAAMFADRHLYAGMRSRIITSHPELQERELIKLQVLAEAIGAALTAREVPTDTAVLAAQAGVTVFHVAFGRWVVQDDATALRPLMNESLAQLRSVIAAP